MLLTCDNPVDTRSAGVPASMSDSSLLLESSVLLIPLLLLESGLLLDCVSGLRLNMTGYDGDVFAVVSKLGIVI